MKINKQFTFLGFAIVILTVVLLLGSLTWAATKTAKTSNSPVGYVDMERIQKEHPDFISFAELVKDKEAEFNFFKNYLNKQLEGLSKDLQKKVDQEKSGKSADEQAKIQQKYQEEFQKKSGELNNQLTQKNNEISGYLSQQRKVITDKLMNIIEEIAKEKDLSLVVDKSTRFYGGNDITDEVLKKVKASGNGKTDKTGK